MNLFRRFAATFAIVVGVLFAVQTVALPVAQAELNKASVVNVQSDDAPSPVIAIILAIILPGAGHLYVGKAGTGILILALCVVNWCLIYWVLAVLTIWAGGVGGCVAPIFHLILVIWDAWGSYNIAKKKGGAGDLEDVERKTKRALEDEDEEGMLHNPFVRPAAVVF